MRRRRFLPAHELKKKWSIWVAGFWGAVGAIIIVLSAFINSVFSWKIGAIIVVLAVSLAIARALKQPGTEE